MPSDWRPRLTQSQKERFNDLRRAGESDKVLMERILSEVSNGGD